MKTLLLLLISATSLLAFDHSHAKFTEVLKANVKGDNINYAAIHKAPDKLGSYLVDLAAVGKSEYGKWSDDQKMAYLINLYNAATLKLIIDEYPVKSIRDIDSPWKQNRVKLFGKYTSLDHIEHEMLRKDFSDPRIHFGVNCASVGCPSLRAEAFQADKLSAQLDEQARNFLSSSSKNRVDSKNGILYLSSIFDWFKGDFVKKSGSVEKFIAPYLSGGDRKAVEGGNLKVKYTEYDWSLNKS
ncbi:MAG: DUF547 domain-containing protein [Akkermansiaceae bacterium]|nr:DUF547 domain-containing protein [Akkermansiaceae bacterium]MDP4645925.1 DUF547 domain-containing protein [Akkermansiaceae bacterium]MDP4722399.1 DUF547 domain-containing protein [Akkermansiaceae bacterium]MDP4779245.1 DUF547 domain-containing protein [Akkermansiaceae bacterium]MDP4848139.1 DUF547 domain-containing protein [Akkermansiaceae bacterium]